MWRLVKGIPYVDKKLKQKSAMTAQWALIFHRAWSRVSQIYTSQRTPSHNVCTRRDINNLSFFQPSKLFPCIIPEQRARWKWLSLSVKQSVSPIHQMSTPSLHTTLARFLPDVICQKPRHKSGGENLREFHCACPPWGYTRSGASRQRQAESSQASGGEGRVIE